MKPSANNVGAGLEVIFILASMESQYDEGVSWKAGNMEY